jgi:hypothetical protein
MRNSTDGGRHDLGRSPLAARRLKPGSYEAFRSAWDPGQPPEGCTRIYHCRDVEDPDVIISFGLFDGTLEGLRQAQARLGRQSQVDRIGPHVQDVLLDGSYEIAEQLTPVSGPSPTTSARLR